MEKQWKEFGDNNAFRISNYGEVQSRLMNGSCRSKDRLGDWHPLSVSRAWTDKHGGYYMQFGCKINGKFRSQRVHRFVAALFIRPIKKGEQVNHIDGNRENNRLDNLEIVSPKDNIRNAVERGVFAGLGKCKGAISAESLNEIICMIATGKTNKEIAKKFNVDPSNISKIRHGKWKAFKTEPSLLTLVEQARHLAGQRKSRLHTVHSDSSEPSSCEHIHASVCDSKTLQAAAHH